MNTTANNLQELYFNIMERVMELEDGSERSSDEHMITLAVAQELREIAKQVKEMIDDA